MTKEEVKKVFKSGNKLKISADLEKYFKAQKYYHPMERIRGESEDIVAVAREIFNS